MEKIDNSLRNKCVIFSRITGYLRPIQAWNKGKQEEFKNRKTFKIKNIDEKGTPV